MPRVSLKRLGRMPWSRIISSNVIARPLCSSQKPPDLPREAVIVGDAPTNTEPRDAPWSMTAGVRAGSCPCLMIFSRPWLTFLMPVLCAGREKHPVAAVASSSTVSKGNTSTLSGKTNAAL
eukprot:8680576-Lingulodinium_polyedra.AAC.1